MNACISNWTPDQIIQAAGDAAFFVIVVLILIGLYKLFVRIAS